MKRVDFNKLLNKAGALALTAIVCAAPVAASGAVNQRPASPPSPPSLSVTNDPLPVSLENKIYTKPAVAPIITPADVMSPAYFDEKGETPVGRKVDNVRHDLFELQARIGKLADVLLQTETSGQGQAVTYYASVATINTQLQSGTTPGNPRLLQKYESARQALDQFSGNIQTLNDLSLQISNAASNASYLLETVRATYGLSGAVEEDHVRLSKIEDSINNTSVAIDRLLNNVNDDITRITSYLNTERDNLRTLALAIQSGNMFNKSLSNRPFSQAQLANFTPEASSGGLSSPGLASPTALSPQPTAGSQAGMRPLVKIRFDRPDVDYQQPLYMAVNEALKRYPDARFELVAVHPSKGNAAEIAIESTKARREGERVLRSLTQMGLDMGRIDLAYTPSAEATTSEVHLYVR